MKKLARSLTDAKGRHTTTRRELFLLPDGGCLIDTPGMRELGQWDASEGIDHAFDEVQALATNRRFRDCCHQGEPECAVLDAVATGELAGDRLASFDKLRREQALPRAPAGQAGGRHEQGTVEGDPQGGTGRRQKWTRSCGRVGSPLRSSCSFHPKRGRMLGNLNDVADRRTRMVNLLDKPFSRIRRSQTGELMENSEGRFRWAARLAGRTLTAVAVLLTFGPLLSALASAVLVLVSRYGGMLPNWAVDGTNPYAWVTNATGITSWKPGFLYGIADGIPFDLIGLPSLGAFVVWIALACAPLTPALEDSWGMGAVAGIFAGLFFGSVGQFVVQKGLLSAANHRAELTSERGASIEVIETEEANALRNVFYIAKQTSSPGIFADEYDLRPIIRLSVLQDRGRIGPLFWQPTDHKIKVGTVEMTLRSELPPVEMPQASASYLEKFGKAQKRIFSESDDLSSLSTLNSMDPLVTIAFSAAVELRGLLMLMQGVDRDAVSDFSRNNRGLFLHVLDASARPASLGGETEIAASYDGNGKIRLFYSSKADRRSSRVMLEKLGNEMGPHSVLRTLKRLFEPAPAQPVAARAGMLNDRDDLAKDVSIPLTHEIWHYFSSQTRRYKKLAPALDEGFATILQVMDERLFAAAEAAIATMPSSDMDEGDYTIGGKTKAAMVEQFKRVTSKTEDSYRQLLRDSTRLIPARKLLLMTPDDIGREGTLLPYAQGWAMAKMLITAPRTVDELMARVINARRGEDSMSEAAYWDALDRELSRRAKKAFDAAESSLGGLLH